MEPAQGDTSGDVRSTRALEPSFVHASRTPNTTAPRAVRFFQQRGHVDLQGISERHEKPQLEVHIGVDALDSLDMSRRAPDLFRQLFLRDPSDRSEVTHVVGDASRRF